MNHHYHLILLIDSSQTQQYRHHLERAERIWNQVIGFPEAKGLVNFCEKDKHGNPQKNGIKIRRNDSETFNAVYNWASYLAKINTKGTAPVGVREWGAPLVPATNCLI